MRQAVTLGTILAMGLSLAACMRQDAATNANGHVARESVNAKASRQDLLPVAASSTAQPPRFASLPDRGELLRYDAQAPVRDGAYTWHRTELSEQHAIDAVTSGMLRVTAPDGRILGFRYDHSIRHEQSGDWTWVGHLAGQEGVQAILTFGKEAVFGSIGQPGARPLRLTVQGGASWLVETDPAQLVGIASHAANPVSPDYQIVTPEALQRLREKRATAASMQASVLSPTTASATIAATPTVDLVIGYTQGFVTAKGSTSAVVTRLNSMVDTANVGLSNSQVNGQLRLVHTMQVNYTDSNSNETALDQLTGSDGQDDVPVNAAFDALRDARETYGADLVSLVRPFKTPEQDSCGVAWIMGGGKRGATVAPDNGWDFYGYSVVSDGIDKDEGDGKTYFCEEHTLAHELGHNMGSDHDRDNSKGDDDVLDDPDDYGAFAYSFGYKPTAFYTIMAYGDSGQTSYLVFSNPRTTSCGGVACGVTDSEDNARSLGQLLPIVAQFRATEVSPGLNLYAVEKNGSSNVEIHAYSADSKFTSQLFDISTPLAKSGTDDSWTYSFADYNRDGVADLYAIKKVSAKVQVHILDGADAYSSFLYWGNTPLSSSGNGPAWEYEVGDYDRDGNPDIFAIKKSTTSGKTEVHILDGATKYQTYLLRVRSALGAVGATHGWKFRLGDYNGDGVLDLLALKKIGSSGRSMEVHILNGASKYGTFLLRTTIPFAARSSSDNGVDFVVGDYDKDGRPDIYLIKKQDPTETEVHVLSGGNRYQTFLLRTATALPPTGTDSSWEFGLVLDS